MRQYLFSGLLMLCCTYTMAQIKPKKVYNNTSLELVYKSALVNEYNYSTGGGRSFFVEVPYVRINGARPVYIDRRADLLRTYYTRCSVADLHLDEMNKQVRRAKTQFWIGAGAGVITAMSGVFAMAKSDRSSSVFWTRVGIGSGLMLTGGILGNYHMRKADKHLRLSVDEYTAQCYKPQTPDTSAPVNHSKPVVQEPSPKKYHQESVGYEQERNDPGNSGLVGVTIDPVLLDIHAMNMSARGGGSLFYTYKSLFNVTGSFNMAYVDNLGGNYGSKEPYGDVETYGIPSDYKRSWEAGVQSKISVLSWIKESKYHLRLGRGKIGRMNATVVGRLSGLVSHALTARLGYQIDQRVVESENGLQFQTNTAPYEYHYNDQVYSLSADNIATSSAIQKSGIITVGVAYSTFRDMKINLDDDEYTGRREEKAQTDFFIDVLYAHSLQLQDMTYYHALYPYTGEYKHLPQSLDISSSPVKKIGARIGYQSLVMYKPHYGLKTMLELGIRPGIAAPNKGESLYLKFGFGFVFGGRLGSNQ